MLQSALEALRREILDSFNLINCFTSFVTLLRKEVLSFTQIYRI